VAGDRLDAVVAVVWLTFYLWVTCCFAMFRGVLLGDGVSSQLRRCNDHPCVPDIDLWRCASTCTHLR